MALDKTTQHPPVDAASLRVALVGYGEVGSIFAAALAKAGVKAVSAFDVLVTDDAWAATARARATRDSVVLEPSLEAATSQATLVICAVTAAQARRAASEIAAVIPRGAFMLDMNSASPGTKTACADVVNAAGAQYVEAAVMASVPPHGLGVPMLLGGPHAQALQPALAALGFDAPVGSPTYGVVSAIKLCRSVFVKGLEAIAVESLLAARHYGVEDAVLASLAETYPGIAWDKQSDWYWRRVVQHGRRRAEEMREAAAMVDDAGHPSQMAPASADVQAWMASLRAGGTFDGLAKEAGWREFADRILAKGARGR